MTGSVSLAADAVPAATRSVRIAASIQIAAAILLLVLLFLEWVRGGRIGLEGNGGGGFGILTLITALVALYAAVQGLRGHRSETRLLGPNQMATALALSLFASNLVFLWVFNTGGAPKWVYIGSNAIVYASVLGLFSSRPDQAPPLADRQIRGLGIATAALGVAIAAAPMVEYTKLSSVTFTGYEPGAPRIGLLFLIVGAVTTFYGVHRAAKGAPMADLGPFVLWPHITMGLGVLATAPAFAWMVSGLWGTDFDPGVGVYLNLLAGLGLFGVGLLEALRRSAIGV
ncbi:MAG: hypothetical protein ACR2QK_17270 [Acidimicrobiales bacterium]